MQRRITEWLFGKQTFGVALDLKSGEDWQVDLVEIQRSRKEIKIVDKGDTTRTTEDLWAKLPAHAKISLNLLGAGILIKEVSTDQLEHGIANILPNVKPEEFIFQTLNLKSDRSVVAMMRKDLLSSIVKEFSQRNIWVVDLCLGPVGMQIIGTLFADNTKLIHLPGMELGIEEGEFTHFKKSKERYSGYYSVAGENLQSSQLLPFAASVSAVVTIHAKNQTDEIATLTKEFFARQVLRKGSFLALVLLFLVVLINFVAFDSLRGKQAELSSQVETGKNLLIKLDELRNNFSQKEDFLKKSGLNKSSRLSFYADRLAADLPGEVRLTLMEINPMIKKIRKEEEMIFGFELIIVKGETMHPLELNRWIQNLKTEKWVAKLEKQEYFLKQKNKPAEFVIEISVR